MRASPLLFRLSTWVGAMLFALAAVSAFAAPVPLRPDERTTLARELGLPGVSAAAFAPLSVIRNLEFARYGDTALELDLYLPPHPDTPGPCVIVIAGGGFKAVDRTRFRALAAYLALQGYTAACVDYRGAPKDPFPSSVEDTKAAVRWVRANASAYGIDPERIGAIGQSAGAHLAVMLAVTGDASTLEGAGGNPGVSSRIRSAVGLAGVYDFISRFRPGGHQKTAIEERKKANELWMGIPFSETSNRWRQASPINYVTADDAPVLFVHCKGDPTAPFEQSVQMHAAMQAVSPGSRLVLYEGGGHGIFRIAGIKEQMWRETLAFFRETLGR
jgi:acetyl esterase/lipase